jgi:gas vesicle protein
MKHSNTGLSFLSGAFLGAAAMYILDPEAGERRRHAIGSKASDALHGTGDRLGDAWGSAHKLGADLISHAQDLASHLADRTRAGAAVAADQLSGVSDQAADARDQTYKHLKGLQGRVAELGQELLGRARHAAGQARDSVEQAQQAARESTHPLRHKIAQAIDPDHVRGPGHAAAYTSAGVGAVALGAAAMYFLDPAKGAERRDFVVNQVSKCMQETGHVCRLAGQYVTRLWHGRNGSPEPQLEASDPMAGEQLVRRVRGEISHLLANPARVQLMADADGIVTVYGIIPPDELDAVLMTITNVPGVTSVLDRLDSPDTADRTTGSSPMESAPQL